MKDKIEITLKELIEFMDHDGKIDPHALRDLTVEKLKEIFGGEKVVLPSSVGSEELPTLKPKSKYCPKLTKEQTKELQQEYRIETHHIKGKPFRINKVKKILAKKYNISVTAVNYWIKNV